MFMRVLFGLLFVLFFVSCDHRPTTTTGKDSSAKQQADSSQSKTASYPGTLTITPALLNKYKEACLYDTASYDKRFVSHFFDIIRQFNGRKLDTTILTAGNLDGDSNPDSIVSRIYLDSGSIYVASKWLKNHQVLWQDEYTDPYTELNADLIDTTRDNTWVYFAIGILYGPPHIHARNELDSGALSVVYEEGVDDLKKLGINVTQEQYKAYLRDFKGDLLTCGQPESRERLWIWYKPAGRMITYYQP